MLQLSLKRRLFYISIIYLTFIALLAAVEIGARLTLTHVSSLDLFVATSQQKAQVANAQQSGIVSLARERGAGVIVIAAPYRDSVTNPPEAELMARYRKVLRAEMEQKGISFLEVTELTEAAYPSNQGWFGELIHPNHMGHRLMAAELLELLSAERLATGLTVPTLTP